MYLYTVWRPILSTPCHCDNFLHLVDLFLDEISECFGKDAVLLILTPKTIGGKNVKDLFTEYVPRKSRFVEDIMFLVRDLALLHVQYIATASITVVSQVVSMDARTQLVIMLTWDIKCIHLNGSSYIDSLKF